MSLFDLRITCICAYAFVLIVLIRLWTWIQNFLLNSKRQWDKILKHLTAVIILHIIHVYIYAYELNTKWNYFFNFLHPSWVHIFYVGILICRSFFDPHFDLCILNSYKTYSNYLNRYTFLYELNIFQWHEKFWEQLPFVQKSTFIWVWSILLFVFDCTDVNDS